jgi:hypothetical protein
VYATDADAGTAIWQVSVLANGETPSDTHGCSQVTPEIGGTDDNLKRRFKARKLKCLVTKC